MSEYLALPDGAGSFPQDFSGPVVLRNLLGPFVLRLQGFHLLRQLLSRQFRLQLVVPFCKPYNPDAAETTSVWAVPRSLATT